MISVVHVTLHPVSGWLNFQVHATRTGALNEMLNVEILGSQVLVDLFLSRYHTQESRVVSELRWSHPSALLLSEPTEIALKFPSELYPLFYG